MDTQTIESLLENAVEGSTLLGLDLGRQTTIMFHGFEEMMSMASSYVPKTVSDVYSANYALFAPENLTSEWRSFINDACDIREEKGITAPIAPMVAVINILISDKELCAKVLSHIGKDDNDCYYFTDPSFLSSVEEMRSVVNYFLCDVTLRQQLIGFTATCLPYRSADFFEPKEVMEFLKEKDLEGALVLDIGCGDGEKTVEMFEGTGAKTYGVDSQYLPEHFDEFWGQSDLSRQYINADASALPFKSNSVDVVTAVAVFGHLNEEAVSRILKETKRVLKEGGILIVGPQFNGEISRYFRGFRLIEESFVEIKKLS